MAEVTVKSGNVTATVDESRVILRNQNGNEVTWPFDDWEVLSSMVRDKRFEMENKKRKNKGTEVAL